MYYLILQWISSNLLMTRLFYAYSSKYPINQTKKHNLHNVGLIVNLLQNYEWSKKKISPNPNGQDTNTFNLLLKNT